MKGKLEKLPAKLSPRLPEKLPTWKLWMFALGQMGWSLASFGVSNLLTYFYKSPETASTQRIFPPFIYEGVFIGLTIIGIINFGSRLFDAVTNPLIASWSDRSRARLGRRRFFMLISFLPFALFSVLVFIPLRHFAIEPTAAASWLNVVWLTVTTLIFYFFFVMYTAPFNALISELGHNPQERIKISAAIGVTWCLGFGVGNSVYFLKDILQSAGMSPTGAFQTIQIGFAVLSAILMALPVIIIDERRYAASAVSEEGTIQALVSSLRNRNFVRFLFSELMYNICQTIIQIGLVYYIVTLLRLEEDMTTFMMFGMFILSFAFYPPILAITRRWEKRKVMLVGFVLLALLFVLFSLMGKVPMNGRVYGWITAAFAALPIAIFTVVPNAVVADIAEADGIETGSFKAGMFFGVRTFETNVGVSIANGLFPSLLGLGMSVAHPFGIRLSAIVSVVFCVAGLLLFFLYDEKAVLKSLAKKEKPQPEKGRGSLRSKRPSARPSRSKA